MFRLFFNDFIFKKINLFAGVFNLVLNIVNEVRVSKQKFKLKQENKSWN